MNEDYFNILRKVCLIGLTVLASLSINCLVILAGKMLDVYKLTILLVAR